MSLSPLEVLKKYWNYDKFRQNQEEIINSIIGGHDILAVLATGGGKSICFQVPGLVFGGVTLVISPLIALMADQVENLKKNDIKAICLHSGLSKNELEIEYRNIKNGKYNFVYSSPERLKSERFIEILTLSDIKLLVVDEAHCISQWGYDFRPEYLLISEIREILTNVPCAALTASATLSVQDDIVKYLLFRDNYKILKHSIVRRNLYYSAINTENKIQKTLEIVSKIKGSGIVYVRSRRQVIELASFLNNNKINAGFYHAGMDSENRELNRQKWQTGYNSVIVCTNAFGMGIDKNDVRYVLHFDIPESPEAYYQESGRAGRDSNNSKCVLLFNNADIEMVKSRIQSKFFEKNKLESIFTALCNFLQIPYGAGGDENYFLDIELFARNFNLKISEINTALKMLENEDILKTTEAFRNPPKLRILVENLELYKFYLKNPNYEIFIKTILRMYGGIFDNYIQISEFEIARNLKSSKEKVCKALQLLTKVKLFDYIPQNEKPSLTLLIPRQLNLPYNKKRWDFLKKNTFERFDAIVDYAKSKTCRQVYLANYFGEENTEKCKVCDICRSNNQNSELEVKHILKKELFNNPKNINEIHYILANNKSKIEIFRTLLDKEIVLKNAEGFYKWNEKK